MGSNTSKPPATITEATGTVDHQAALAGLAQLDADIAQLDSMPSLPDELPDDTIADLELPGDDVLGAIEDGDVELDEDTMLEVMQELEQLELEHEGSGAQEGEPKPEISEVSAQPAADPSTTATQQRTAGPAKGEAEAVQGRMDTLMQPGAAAVKQPASAVAATPAAAAKAEAAAEPDPDRDELDALRDEMAA